MKKAAISFSLTVLVIFFIYTSFKMTDDLRQSPSYEGITQESINSAVEKSGAISSTSIVVSDFRSYDTICEAILLFTASTVVLVILKKQRKSKGGK